MNFIEKVEKLFKENYGAQAAIAKKLGISSSAFSNSIRRGSDKMTMNRILAIADHFGVSVDYLLRDDIDDLYYEHKIPVNIEEAKKLLEELFTSFETPEADKDRIARLTMDLWLSHKKDN